MHTCSESKAPFASKPGVAHIPTSAPPPTPQQTVDKSIVLRTTHCPVSELLLWSPASDSKAKFLHCVRTACILRTQRLGYSPNNTCHLSSSMAKQQSPPVVHVTPFKCPTTSTIVCSCVLCWERS